MLRFLKNVENAKILIKKRIFSKKNEFFYIKFYSIYILEIS